MKTDHDFAQALLKSTGTVHAVAAWMKKKGYDVVIKPTLKGSHSQWRDHADDGDIEIRQTIEVKRISLDWTCCDDFPKTELIVDEAYKTAQHTKQSLWGYMLMNKSGTHLCHVPGASMDHWKTRKIPDRNYEGKEREFSVYSKFFCNWRTL